MEEEGGGGASEREKPMNQRRRPMENIFRQTTAAQQRRNNFLRMNDDCIPTQCNRYARSSYLFEWAALPLSATCRLFLPPLSQKIFVNDPTFHWIRSLSAHSAQLSLAVIHPRWHPIGHHRPLIGTPKTSTGSRHRLRATPVKMRNN